MGESKGKILLFSFIVCFDMQTTIINVGQKSSDKDNISKQQQQQKTAKKTNKQTGNEAGTSGGFFFQFSVQM